MPDDVIKFACDSCGKPVSFPAEAVGTTESCPHCEAYVDVPETGFSPIVRHVFHEFREFYGEPDHHIVFDDSIADVPASDHAPDRIDVVAWDSCVWTPDNHKAYDVFTFATIGMSNTPMIDVDHRAELRMTIRKELSSYEINELALFLANLAIVPFNAIAAFDWWKLLPIQGSLHIPLFPDATTFLFHPRFFPDESDEIHFEESLVKIINVVPLSESVAKMGTMREMMEYLWDTKGDPFTPTEV